MRKLSLGKLKLASEEVLQRSQLAMIYGGSGSEPVMISCTCSTSGDGTNRCCSVHYGSNSQQSGTGCT
jgi:natural product precursor